MLDKLEEMCQFLYNLTDQMLDAKSEIRNFHSLTKVLHY